MAGPGSFSEGQMGEMKVYAKCHLQQGVMFGPYLGEVCKGQMPANLKYAWAVSRRKVSLKLGRANIVPCDNLRPLFMTNRNLMLKLLLSL